MIRHAAALVFTVIGMPSLASDERAAGFDCVITPSQTVDLSSSTPGQLEEVLVDRGERVSVGQIVARLDARLEQASLDIASLRADWEAELRLRETEFEIDQRTEKRLSTLVASSAASAHDRDRAAGDARLSAWRVLQAKADMQLHELERSRAQAALENRRVRSPMDGVVAARLRDPGEHVDGEALLRIVKLDPLSVEAILPMRLFGLVRAGMTARVFPELDKGRSLEATVSAVDPMGDAGSGTFGARFALPNPGEGIPAGVKCRVALSIDAPGTDR